MQVLLAHFSKYIHFVIKHSLDLHTTQFKLYYQHVPTPLSLFRESVSCGSVTIRLRFNQTTGINGCTGPSDVHDAVHICKTSTL